MMRLLRLHIVRGRLMRDMLRVGAMRRMRRMLRVRRVLSVRGVLRVRCVGRVGPMLLMLRGPRVHLRSMQRRQRRTRRMRRVRCVWRVRRVRRMRRRGFATGCLLVVLVEQILQYAIVRIRCRVGLFAEQSAKTIWLLDRHRGL